MKKKVNTEGNDAVLGKKHKQRSKGVSVTVNK